MSINRETSETTQQSGSSIKQVNVGNLSQTSPTPKEHIQPSASKQLSSEQSNEGSAKKNSATYEEPKEEEYLMSHALQSAHSSPLENLELERLKYQPEFFVEREQKSLKDSFWSKIRKLQQGKEVSNRTLAIHGEAGFGKTWLLSNIHSQITTKTSPLDNQKIEIEQNWLTLSSYYLDLYSETTNKPSLVAVTDILHDFARDVLNRSLADVSPSNLSLELIKSIRKHLEKHVLILLIDAVYETDWEILKELEHHFLGPVAVEKRVFIVLAGRGPAFSWASPELGFRREQQELRKFSLEETRAQIDALPLDELLLADVAYEIVYSYSQGIPLITYLLVTSPDVQHRLNIPQYENVISPGNFRAIIRQFLAIGLPRQRYETELDEIFFYLQALCVLRIFRDEHMPNMFTIYDAHSLEPAELDHTPATVRRKLVHYGYAHWNRKRRAHQIDDPIRTVIERYVLMRDIEIWKELHCGAYRLYEEWAGEYPSTAPTWQEEMAYHRKQLEQKGYDLQQCDDKRNSH